MSPLSPARGHYTPVVSCVHDAYVSKLLELACVCVFFHTAEVSAAVLLLPALSFDIGLAFDDRHQYTMSLGSSIIDERSEK